MINPNRQNAKDVLVRPVAIVPAYDAIDTSALNAISIGEGVQVSGNTFKNIFFVGYWRQQLAHIAGHLKKYTETNKEFRSIVSQHKIGKVQGAYVDLYESDGIMTISLDFELITKGLAEVVEKEHFKTSAQSR